MTKIRVIGLVIASLLFSEIASADVILSGKTQSKVTATVVRMFTFDVTDDKGGWFDQGLEMQQLGGWNTPYEVSTRLRIVSTSRDFQVRLDEPLQIRNQSNPSQVFRQPSVSLGAEEGAPKQIVVGQSTAFRNPAPPTQGDDSTGYYTLSISAYPPEGDFRSTVGTYSGTLSMTFEPVIKAP